VSTHRGRGALTLTFDNLGEASSIARGEQPGSQSLGRHPSVTSVLPRLLDALDEHGLRATFFVEAVNCERYPDALAEIAARGHELGHHSWAHETWGELEADREAELLRRGLDAFAALGLEVTGFRPPGGALTPRTPALLRDAGLGWCSPVGDEPRVEDGLVYVPFQWPLVDAFHLMASFVDLRKRLGEPRAPADPWQMGRQIDAALDALAREGGHRSLILHPFLAVRQDVLDEHLRLLGAIAARARAGDLEVGPGGPLAERLRERCA
jgi:peptidoglycan/xylan/chitin deacetylase (PgdA/CDA1 family)